MRELPRDLVTILRTEARNQRTPPIDYAIAEDGLRMVVRPEPDIAMAELLEEAADKLEELAAELEMWQTVKHSSHWKERAEKAEAALAEKDKEIEALRKKANDWSMEADKYKRALTVVKEYLTARDLPRRQDVA